MTTINHEVNEMIQLEEDTYNVIVDLKAMLEHYVSGRAGNNSNPCLLYTSPSPRDGLLSRMPSSA